MSSRAPRNSPESREAAAIPFPEHISENLLDHESWNTAPLHELALPPDQEHPRPKECGFVQFGWNPAAFLARMRFVDSSVQQTNRQDQQYHFMTGDLAELFLKPVHAPYYWENYATPFGNRTTFFFTSESSSGALPDLPLDDRFGGLRVWARIGSFRIGEEIFEGWEAAMMFPSDHLRHFGEGWGPGSEWSLLCARYNYNGNAAPERSAFPLLSRTRFHLTAEYARIRFTTADHH